MGLRQINFKAGKHRRTLATRSSAVGVACPANPFSRLAVRVLAPRAELPRQRMPAAAVIDRGSNGAGDDLPHAFTAQEKLVRDLVKRATLFAEGSHLELAPCSFHGGGPEEVQRLWGNLDVGLPEVQTHVGVRQSVLFRELQPVQRSTSCIDEEACGGGPVDDFGLPTSRG